MPLRAGSTPFYFGRQSEVGLRYILHPSVFQSLPGSTWAVQDARRRTFATNLMHQINRQLDSVMQRFAAKYDHWCEVGVGDMRGLRRWLVSVLAPEITSPPAPQIHPNNRVWLTSPKRGISRLIGGGGGAR